MKTVLWFLSPLILVFILAAFADVLPSCDNSDYKITRYQELARRLDYDASIAQSNADLYYMKAMRESATKSPDEVYVRDNFAKSKEYFEQANNYRAEANQYREWARRLSVQQSSP